MVIVDSSRNSRMTIASEWFLCLQQHCPLLVHLLRSEGRPGSGEFKNLAARWLEETKKVHPQGGLLGMIFWTLGYLNRWFWTVFDGLFGSNRRNCSQTVEIAAKAIRRLSGTSLPNLLSHSLLYYSLLYFPILSSIEDAPFCLLSTISQDRFVETTFALALLRRRLRLNIKLHPHRDSYRDSHGDS